MKNWKQEHSFVAMAGFFLMLGVGAYLYASKIEARRYRLERIAVATGGNNGADSDNSKAFALKILHLSDLHLTWPESHKVRFLQKVTDDDYDLVILTGDVFENYSGLPHAADILSRQPRLGAYAVLGNHDYYDYTILNRLIGRVTRKYRHPPQKRNIEPMVKALSDGGFTVMRNSAITLKDAPVHIIGVDYPGISENQLGELVAQAPPDHLIISLFHLPNNLEFYQRAGVHLGFGGHTHGGQVRIPGFGAIITDSELKRHEASGLVLRGETVIHISRGISQDPRTNFRLFCPPAATVIEVKHRIS